MNSIDLRNASPELLNVWRYISNHVSILSITPTFYQGSIAAPYTAFAAGTVWLALAACFYGPGTNATVPYIEYTDEHDTSMGYMTNNSYAYSAADKWSVLDLQVNNFYFGRVTNQNYSKMRFNGYKLTF